AWVSACITSWSSEGKSGILQTRPHPIQGERNGAKPFPCWHMRQMICIIISQEGGKSMSAEENKQVARRWINAFLAGDTAVLEELVVEDFVDHNPQPVQKPARQGLLVILAGWRAAFPDLQATILHEVAEGEFVVQHGVALGTN